jgi:hypothetical protein
VKGDLRRCPILQCRGHVPCYRGRWRRHGARGYDQYELMIESGKSKNDSHDDGRGPGEGMRGSRAPPPLDDGGSNSRKSPSCGNSVEREVALEQSRGRSKSSER